MDKKYFWDEWALSESEKEGIKSIKKAKSLILEKVPEEELISIYVKGSFVRREMVPGSDVDLVAVVKSDKYLDELDKLRKQGKDYNPEFGVSGYSLNELETCKRK